MAGMRKRLSSPLLCGAALLLLIACQQRPAPPLPESNFTFLGTLRLQGTSTLDLEATDSLAVIRVEKVYQVPPRLPELRGSLVTVRLKDPGSARVGEARVYFTRLLQVGEGIGVVEMGSLEGKEAEDGRALRERIRRDQERRMSAARRTWMDGADRVIRAKVARVREPGPEEFPEWTRPFVEVRLAVAKTFKGPREDSITAYYGFPDSVSGGGPAPTGMGPPATGWEGIFLLEGSPDAKAGKSGKAAGPLAILRRIEADKDILADLKSLH